MLFTKKLSSFAIMLAAIAITGCKKEFAGHLLAYENIKVNSKEGDSIIPAGDHSLEFTVKSKKKALIEVMPIGGEPKTVLEVRFEKGAIPENNGPIFISGSDSGQPFDLFGYLTTTSSEKGPYRKTESCRYTRHEPVCWGTPQGVVCRTELREVLGWQDIEYYLVTYDQDLELAIREVASERVLGDIVSRNTETTQKVVYSSGCR